jgi:hypothetical protein
VIIALLLFCKEDPASIDSLLIERRHEINKLELSGLAVGSYRLAILTVSGVDVRCCSSTLVGVRCRAGHRRQLKEATGGRAIGRTRECSPPFFFVNQQKNLVRRKLTGYKQESPPLCRNLALALLPPPMMLIV